MEVMCKRTCALIMCLYIHALLLLSSPQTSREREIMLQLNTKKTFQFVKLLFFASTIISLLLFESVLIV